MLKKLLPIAMLLSCVVGLGAYVSNGVFWPNVPVKYYINTANTSGMNPATVVSDIQAGGNAWATQASSGATLSYQGTTSDPCTFAYDQKNHVCFRVDSGGWIAYTQIYTFTGQTAILDADMIVNTTYPLFTDDQQCNGGYSIKNTVTHEFGHLFGLGHSADPTATMYPTANACETSKEVLSADDIAGILSLYPTAGPPPPAAPVLTSVSPSSGAQGTTVPVTLSGSNFVISGTSPNISGSGVTFSNIVANNTTSMTANFVISSAAVAGARTVTVTTSSGTSGTQPFTVTVPPPPSAPATPSNPSPANMGTVRHNSNTTLTWVAAGATRYTVVLDGVAHAVTPASYKAGKVSVGVHTWSVTATNNTGSTNGPTWTFTSN
jgi:hypothetical protein